MSLYVFFKPLHIKEQTFKDVPMFELSSFVVYEINKIGLDTMMLGDNATRYENRYVVKNINYTDNTKEYILNIKANNGLYKDKIVNLVGDVVLSREDGLTFETSSAEYNQQTSITTIDNDYVAYRGESFIVGSSAVYNHKKNKVQSKKVVANYKLSEKSI